jgi:STE24 endopeptidase
MGFARWRRVGERWWLFAAPVFIGLAVLFSFISPWLLGGTPYHRDVRELERIENVRHVPVRVLDGFDEPNAFATGLGTSRRVFLWEPILEAPFTPREDRFVLAHELGHLAHEHIWKSLAWYALFAIPGAYLIARITRRRGGMGVPEAVPLGVLVLVVLQLLQLPLQNMITRHMEAEADWSALKATRDASAGRGLFEHFATVSLDDPRPPWWDYVLLENHPTLMQRIAMARAWGLQPR